ncbi:hypothetical protein X975_25559, partial [Stegodyphus mimosarum]
MPKELNQTVPKCSDYQADDEESNINEGRNPDAIYVRGFFTYKDPQGVERVVKYVSDNNGFQVMSPTNGASH